ncbi:MAG TPA: hypothetical protein VNT42_13175 [Sphingomonas sp.]|nr:hypothetical protein [Sphingomonas sp.]
MSATLLQQLNDAQAALDAALDARDLDALDAASAAVAVVVEEVRVVGGWRDRPGLREDLVQILKNAEAARGRINALTDLNRRRLDKLVSLAGAPRAVAYQRSGKLG